MTTRLRYFDGVRTLKDARRLYRELAKRLHPDNRTTGNDAWFKEMATEYERVIEALRARRKAVVHLRVEAEPPTASSEQRSVEKPKRSRRKPDPEVHRALEELADAAGNVLSALLKQAIR